MYKKIAVVTGASAGIGQAITWELAAQGYIVYANARSEERLKETLEKGEERNYDIRPLIFDVSVIPEIKEKISSLGRIDCLVNNAAYCKYVQIEDITEEDWDGMLNTNLKGYFFCSQFALAKMSAGACIINLSSGAALTGGAYVSVPYAAIKGAINTMTLGFATKLAPKGIRVNVISPGFVETKMLKKSDSLTNEYYASLIPLGFLGTPEDIAHSVSFLASDKARYITGQIWEVNGGDIMG